MTRRSRKYRKLYEDMGTGSLVGCFRYTRLLIAREF